MNSNKQTNKSLGRGRSGMNMLKHFLDKNNINKRLSFSSLSSQDLWLVCCPRSLQMENSVKA